jgi:hypothetical protein
MKVDQETREKISRWGYELGKILETYSLPAEAFDVVKDIYMEIEGVLR